MDRDKIQALVEYLSERNELVEKRLHCIQTIAASLGSSLQMDDVLHTVAEQVTEMLEAERATIFLVDDETSNLVARVIIGPELRDIVLKPGQGLAGWVAQSGKTLNVKDAYKDRRFDPDFDQVSGFKTTSILCQPMMTYRGRLIGVIQVLNKRKGYFTVEDEHLLSTITTQATISIENSKYFTQLHDTNLRLKEAQENLKRNYERLETLYSIQHQLTQTWEREILLTGVVRELMAAIPCGFGALFIGSPGPPLLVVMKRGAGEPETIFPAAMGGVLGEVSRKGETVVVDKGGAVLQSILHPEVDVEVRCAVVEPLTASDGGEPFGALSLVNRGQLLEFTAEDAQVVRIVARQVSSALERLEAHDRLTRENNLALIGRALSGVVHDLKSPMAVIAGFVQLMEDEEDPSARSEQAEEVLRQFQHINSMMREVLAFARGEATLLKQAIYPDRFLGEMEKHLHQEFDGRNIALKINNESRAKFKADEGKLRRLFTNVARNAMEAMPDGGTFSISAADTEDSIVFRLADTGDGIPEEIRHRLFQSFVTTGKKEGTGLGLAIVKKIVEQHGGSVDFETGTGSGTTFIIKLPRG